MLRKVAISGPVPREKSDGVNAHSRDECDGLDSCDDVSTLSLSQV